MTTSNGSPIESSHSHGALLKGAGALELALARVVAAKDREFARSLETYDAKRQTLEVRFEAVLRDFERLREEFRVWFDDIRTRDFGVPGVAGTPGAPGPAGPPGADGMAGAAGPAGRDGADGAPGAVGPAGAEGPPGAAGIAGRDGLPGVPGPAGRDGAPGVNGKDGADGMAVKDFAVRLEADGRTLVFSLDDGERMREHRLAVPWPIYRGTWKSGSYQHGDMATYAGGIFHAWKATDRPPQTDDWQLAVKRAQDGKNGKDGERGPQGPQGIPGKDGMRL